MNYIITWLLIGSLGLAWGQPTPESSVKAVFIYNFTRFVNWPEAAFTGPDAPFIIGVIGTDPFGTALPEVVTGEWVGKHPILVRYFQQVSEIKDCHLLYISAKEPERVKEMLTLLPHRPMLTVGEVPSFARQGGMIRFMTQNNKIRLEINPGTVRAAQLGISSKLLQVASIVEN